MPEPETRREEDGSVLTVSVPESGRLLLDLATPKLIQAPDAGRASIEWDLAIEGYEVFTNGGASGPGKGSAFGLYSRPTFLSDTAPSAPFLQVDQPGGAFLNWSAYDGDNHQVLSRFHVYGVREGSRLWKVQVLDYYNRAFATPVPGFFTLRYAEVTPDGASETRERSGIDATSAGNAANSAATSACLALDTGELSALTPDQASVSDAWQLCFRRDKIRVNGGLGGPRGIFAVDLDGAATDTETLELLALRTRASELTRFDRVDAEILSNHELSWRSDGIVTAFSNRWLVAGSDPPTPMQGVWLVVGADGTSHYLLQFENFEGATRSSPNQVSLRVKAVR